MAMTIHLTFNNIRNSDAVTKHIHEMFEELLKIIDNKYRFHVRLNKEHDQHYHLGIICNFLSKDLVIASDGSNLSKAVGRAIEFIKTQVLRKTVKLRCVT